MKVEIICLAASVTLLAGCASTYTQPLTLNELPAPAQATVQKEIGNAPITRITQEQKYGATTYRVEVEQKNKNGILWVDPNGQIVKENRSLASQQRRIEESAGAQAPAVTTPSQAPAQSKPSQY